MEECDGPFKDVGELFKVLHSSWSWQHGMLPQQCSAGEPALRLRSTIGTAVPASKQFGSLSVAMLRRGGLEAVWSQQACSSDENHVEQGRHWWLGGRASLLEGPRRPGHDHTLIPWMCSSVDRSEGGIEYVPPSRVPRY